MFWMVLQLLHQLRPGTGSFSLSPKSHRHDASNASFARFYIVLS